MQKHYCSKGHENAATNVYCQQCGEKLNQPAGKGIYPGVVLGDRYSIVREIGHGGFGRTYLAEDLNRFREHCVLKEFAPQVRGTYALQKASELFEREAGVLYKLQHPQIPRFRELFRTKVDEEGHLFLVQDYVEGQSYRALLDTRKRQGLRFSEVEVIQLMLQILPVLEYIHAMNVIHRDISPDNLMLRSSDLLPVLIDFGGVKQVAANAESEFTQAAPGAVPSFATRLGKIGYAPNEQMQVGTVYPHSDLYALAATVLVLLTGKEPQQLIDMHAMTWNWRREISLSPNFGTVLDKMLAYRPGDRYQSARDVLQVLSPPTPATQPMAGGTPIPQPTPPSPTPPSPTPQSEQATLAVSPPKPAPAPPVNPVPSQSTGNSPNFFGKIVLVGVLVAIAGSLGWLVGGKIIPKIGQKPSDKPIVSPTKDPEPPPPPKFSQAERDRKEALRQRRLDLGINYNFYVNFVNQIFWQKNPKLRGTTLSDDPKDEQLRAQWDNIGAELLSNLQQANLSAEARQQLGSFDKNDRDRWIGEVNKLYLSSRALFTLTDAKYSSFASNYSAKKLNLSFEEFLKQPTGQIWHAIAFDKVNALKNNNALEKIVFPPGAIGTEVKGTLPPGEGKAYIAGLDAGQLMKVNLQADPQIILSVYPPTSNQKALLENSPQGNWSGTLPSKGFYEFIVVSKASKPINYRLKLTAEYPPPPPTSSPTPTPSSPPTQTVPATPNPTDTQTPATPNPTQTETPATPSPSATDTPPPSPSATDTPPPSPSATDTPPPSPSATDTPPPPSPSATDTPPPPSPTDTQTPSNGI